MAFLNFNKKGGKLPSDIDLDVPPEPPKMMEEEISTEGPIDEELMPLKRSKPVKEKESKELQKEVPSPLMENRDFLTLPSEEAEELPPLHEESLELPPPPAPLNVKNEKKNLFSFLKLKKVAEKLHLPDIGADIPEMPPLPGEGEEFPEIPSLPGEGETFPEIPPSPGEELPPLPKEVPIAPPMKISAPLPGIGPEPLKPVPKQEVKVEKPIKTKKFVTITDFKQIQNDINSMKNILKGTDGFFVKLEEVKSVGDKEYSGLYNNLQDVQRKIMFVDKTLFKEQTV